MARPTKQGIDYFPVDVQFDDKVELYVAETGAEGLGILITIWQIIYQNEGYYAQNNDNLALLVRRRTMAKIEDIKNCIFCAICQGIFDESLAKKYQILTSKAIQKRYIVASRKKAEVSGVRNYLYDCIIDKGNSYGNLVLERKNATKEEEEEEEEVNEALPVFDDFYRHYPKKKNKQAAQKAWNKLKPTKELLQKMICALEQHKKLPDWKKENGQFIPYPSSWLNGKRWEDEMDTGDEGWI